MFKEPPAQFGKILARTSFPKPSSFSPKPVVSRAPRVVARIGFSSLHSIAVFRSRGRGLKRRRMSRGWGHKKTPALLPEDPRLRSRSGGRASSRAPQSNASPRAQSRPSSRRPAPRVSVPAPRTPYSQGASLRILPVPRDSHAQRDPRLGYPTSCPSGNWTFFSLYPANSHTRWPAPGTPHVRIPGVVETPPLCASSTWPALTSDVDSSTHLCPLPSSCVHVCRAPNDRPGCCVPPPSSVRSSESSTSGLAPSVVGVLFLCVP